MGVAHATAAQALSAADKTLVRGVLAREVRSLARCITLLESTRPDHRARAQAVLEALLPHAGRSIRVGISGAPGVGKSTFIEALGLHLIAQGHRLAVLAVDPTSSVSGGSILGDKTRMDELSRRAEAYIRPSPSGGSLGGVAEKTRETLLACEAAGYDVILVETVGVGQSETAVAGMTDAFALLQIPHAGDDLQAMKKGVVELADLIVVNKVDVDRKAAETAAHHLEMALGMLRPASPNWKTPVLRVSALTREGIESFWETLRRYEAAMKSSGEFAERRRRQALDWMWALIDSALRERFRNQPGVRRQLERAAEAVMRGALTPVAAAASLLALHKGEG